MRLPQRNAASYGMRSRYLRVRHSVGAPAGSVARSLAYVPSATFNVVASSSGALISSRLKRFRSAKPAPVSRFQRFAVTVTSSTTKWPDTRARSPATGVGLRCPAGGVVRFEPEERVVLVERIARLKQRGRAVPVGMGRLGVHDADPAVRRLDGQCERHPLQRFVPAPICARVEGLDPALRGPR